MTSKSLILNLKYTHQVLTESVSLRFRAIHTLKPGIKMTPSARLHVKMSYLAQNMYDNANIKYTGLSYSLSE